MLEWLIMLEDCDAGARKKQLRIIVPIAYWERKTC